MLDVTVVGGLAATVILYAVCQIVYNVYFHPLAKFPGPWWAGATSYAEFYFDQVKGGRYFAEIEAMHARYGSIVRIGPNELAIRDAKFYEQIYGGVGARRDINESFARFSTCPTSVISTINHDHHRARRNPLANFFSKQAITKLEPFIWSRINILVNKFKHAHKTGSVIQAVEAYGALTTDVISYYAYGETFDYLGKGTDLEFRNDYMHAISGLAFSSPLTMHFPIVADCLRLLPQRILKVIAPGMICVNNLRLWCEENAVKVLRAAEYGTKVSSVGKETIFETLLGSGLPQEEKTLQRMTDEGFIITAAGLETTSRFLTNITCHVLLNPEVLSKLRDELKVAMPSPGDCPPCSVLENLPYLCAVVNEGLRCETILVNRFTRIPVEPLPYKDFVIPAGTSIGCAPYIQNSSSEVFPEPDKFKPERWIEARERGENLSKYLGTFVKGGRACLGINLAYTELYLTVAALFRNFDMELVDSGLENITTKRGYQFGFTENYDFGIKLKIAKVLD